MAKSRNYLVTDKAYYDRRRKKILDLLGGKCTACGATDMLEIDHIDPAAKRFNPMRNIKRWSITIEELKKCQLLCDRCHIIKHISPHGTQNRYTKWGCRCVVCVEFFRTYQREYKRRNYERVKDAANARRRERNRERKNNKFYGDQSL